MATIEQVSSPIKKLTKNKNTVLFAGLGVGAGLIVLVMRSLNVSSASSSTKDVSTTSEGSDQSVSVLGSQMQAFAQATQEQNNSIVAKLTAAEQENAGLKNEIQSEKSANDSKFKVLTDQNTSIVSQLIDLQTKQAEHSNPVVVPTVPSNPVIDPSVPTVPAVGVSVAIGPTISPQVRDALRTDYKQNYAAYAGLTDTQLNEKLLSNYYGKGG